MGENATAVVYHNPRCSTSRNTLELLRANGYEPTVVHYLKTPPSRAQLVELLDAMAEHPLLIQRPFVTTARGTRLARPIDAVREIL